MKEIKLKQYIEVRRVVSMMVPDDCTELEAAKMLDEMVLGLDGCSEMVVPEFVRVEEDWDYICDRGIENEDGVTILHEEEEDVDRG